VDPAAVRRAVKLSETRYCGAGAMLSKIARVTHTFRLGEDEALALTSPAPSTHAQS